ncbi:DNA/RNA non-specific endonuclease [Rhizobium phaseoli]|uniref:Serine protease n=1 Tax=Rhizobium phaseoli TaxID=396 RepID=A0ABM6CI03_9HYPH|nr:DNA/RNA non-specific endonuclease [Rhizobium phaseoli]ANL87881.1 DNA/RNA non-specific endonuclease protein [Rhizobium phaseoli]ANL94390.1 DNA/RNA non-specific endonuclease protein [Rhizobium phaseoli]RDJ03646.1 hypothetical protein B5K05_28100 [Rhizobium phaseoli]
MSTLLEQLERLRRFRAAVQKGDPEVAEESGDRRSYSEGFAKPPSPEAIEAAFENESIAMRRERPVLSIQENITQLDFIDQADSKIWRDRLSNARPLLDAAIPAVGRINLVGAVLDWIGTGWLVAENVLVTNRHVASEFVVRKGEGFDFASGGAGRISANTDFLQEIGNSRALVFRLTRPLHVEGEEGPDIAFFEIERISGDQKLAKPIRLATKIEPTGSVAVIGYPAYDSRIAEPDLMERIYGKVYNKKRLAPGNVTRVETTRLWHNCTTLGGNSGSVVLDLTEGTAVGLHFSGSFLKSNYAVRADVVEKLLREVLGGRAKPQSPRSQREKRPEISPTTTRTSTPRKAASPSMTFTIPLTVTVSLGNLDASSTTVVVNAPANDPLGKDDETIDYDEAIASDYADRKGYVPAFLGETFPVDLPEVRRHADDVLAVDAEGGSKGELRYEHFSVIMSRSRRMCFLSACNIDGQQSRKGPRAPWRWDPRIPRDLQIMGECYGTPPMFSRGHMTRREDPCWGNVVVSQRGNEDSMHVTNAVPQMQAFNSPIWLALEDYALQHAREDDMKISVFTGPYFAETDPEMYGVRIPVAFWKVIAFVHDDTKELCATGYEMDQKQSLPPEEEFTFGAFRSPQMGTAVQVPIHRIQMRSGLDFGALVDADPLTEEESIPNSTYPPLLALQQVRFAGR